MVGHSEGIRDILVAYTGYTGGYHPNSRGINEIDATNKFLVKPKETFDMDPHWGVESYTVDVIAESESTLQTMIDAIQNCATDRPSGYIPSSSYEFKLYQQLPAEVYSLQSNTEADNFPIAEGTTADTYRIYPTTSLTTSNTVEATFYISSAYLVVLNLPSSLNFSTAKLGIYITATSETKDSTIHTLNTSIGLYTHPLTYTAFTVGAQTAAITAATADQYNEYTITDLVTEVLGYNSTDSYIKLVIGTANDRGDSVGIEFSRKDSDGSVPSTQFPYLKYTYDFTASGYPYWIGLGPRSENLDLGPNQFGKRIELLASYEVTSS